MKILGGDIFRKPTLLVVVCTLDRRYFKVLLKVKDKIMLVELMKIKRVNLT